MHESIGFYRSQTFGQLYTEAISTVIPIGPCSFGCYSLASFIMELMFTISPSTPLLLQLATGTASTELYDLHFPRQGLPL